MPHRFISQPYASGYDLLDFFEEAANLGSPVECSIVSAWVNSKGLHHLKPHIETLLAAGARVRAVVGVSQGGTSIQGLTALYKLVPDSYVFYMPNRTFHPKVYIARNAKQALTLVGSHNFTAGGARLNFEAGVLSELDLHSSEASEYYSDINNFVDGLIAPGSPSRLLDAALVTAMMNSGVALKDESVKSTGSGGKGKGGGSLFPKSTTPLRGLPSSGGPGATSGSRAGAAGGGGTGATGGAAPNGTTPPASGSSTGATPGASWSSPSARWHKRLGKTDAQQGDSADWHPSNTLTLVNGKNTATYFRQQLFAGLSWEPRSSTTGAAREVVTVKMEVIDDGASLGVHSFELRYTPDYDSNQSNRTTELVWGTMKTHMRSVSHTGDTITIERSSAGTYRMSFSADPLGPKIP